MDLNDALKSLDDHHEQHNYDRLKAGIAKPVLMLESDISNFPAWVFGGDPPT
jgi:peptidyl-tRNA hydrolase